MAPGRAELLRRERDGRRRHDAEGHHGDALGGEPRGQRRLQHLPRDARVATDDEAIDVHDAGRGATQRDDELRREVEVRHAPDSVGSEPQRHNTFARVGVNAQPRAND